MFLAVMRADFTKINAYFCIQTECMMEKNGMEVKSIHTDEFVISSDLADFPVNECPSYLNEGVGAICLAGTALIQVFNTRCRLEPNAILILLPWELVSIKEISSDFRMTFFCISKEMFTDAPSSLWRLTTEFFFYMRKHFVSDPVAENRARFLYSATGWLSARKYCPKLPAGVDHAAFARLLLGYLRALRQRSAGVTGQFPPTDPPCAVFSAATPAYRRRSILRAFISDPLRKVTD